MIRYVFTGLGLLILLIQLSGQSKYEIRAVWIAHVNNIDLPSSPSLSEIQQKQEFIDIVDDLKKNNINAVVIQIRTNCDASYPSNIEPWSAFWTGKQGIGPTYDPLAFMIEECHQRNLEFHAWFNPYRAAPSVISFAADNHVRKQHPEWILSYNGLQMLDPALPDVRNYVTHVVMDVVKRYDIDAVHFDDYFYPYPVTGIMLNDDQSFINHNRGFSNKADWRRDNINLLVKNVSEKIKTEKPWVKFGISPFGIWKNKSTNQSDGSDTRGLEAFHSIYADSRKWVQEGWLDYITPQIYWSIGFSIANFSVLATWWANNISTFNTQLYIGQAVYRINNGGSDPNWLLPTEMVNQIKYLRKIPQIRGSVFYNTTSFRKNLLGFNDTLQQNLYKTKAVIPSMKWIDSIPPSAPINFSVQKLINAVQLNWSINSNNLNETEKVKYYAIYRFDNNDSINIENAKNLIDIVSYPSNNYIDRNITDSTLKYTYFITAFDRLHNESLQSKSETIYLSDTYDPRQNKRLCS